MLSGRSCGRIDLLPSDRAQAIQFPPQLFGCKKRFAGLAMRPANLVVIENAASC
jgi:hypothetical protein